MKRSVRAGFRPARIFSGSVIAAAAFLAAATPVHPASATTAAQSALRAIGGGSVADFYRERGGQPLWLASPQNGRAAQRLIELLNSAGIEGLGRARYDTRRLARAIRAAEGGDARAVSRAETLLSQALVNYARDLKRVPNIGIYYVDSELMPQPPSATALLREAASAPSLEDYVQNMGWMHPTYVQLRRALLGRAYANDAQRRLLAINLERARALPSTKSRYIIVNAAAQRLYMYENGEVVDYMRVVVGKPKNPTPMMTAYVKYASLNPYWNVPPDLAAERIAPNVVKGGVGYLRAKGYQVLSDWGDNPRVIDPRSVDWKAVADGRIEVRLRQLPGPGNAMGRMKFMFPNREGVYLHDTPDKELLTEAARLFSGGCVRLEDAPRLGRWMFGKPLKPQGARPEQKVPLDRPVPVYLTYLTAVPSGSSIAYFDDIYGRDAARMAGGTQSEAVASR